MEQPPLLVGERVQNQKIRSQILRKVVVRGLIVVLALLVAWLGWLGPIWREDLLTAARNGRGWKVQLLIRGGADINQRGPTGETALIQAAWGDHLDLVELLIEHGANLNVQDHDGDTALIWAAADGQAEIASVLIQKGAALDLQDHEGYTALMGATFHGYPDVSRLLVTARADVNLENKDGETALEMASQRGYAGLVQILKQSGAIKTNAFVNKSPYPAKLLSPARAWALATTALLVQYNGESQELLGSVPADQAANAKRLLDTWWGIHDRKGTLHTLDWLMNEGHRVGFEQIRIAVASLTEAQFLVYCDRHSVDAVGIAKLRVVWRNRNDSSGHSLLAWDLCRNNWVAGQAYVAGYLSETEAWTRIMPAARRLQAAYQSWEEMGHAYLEGREYWLGDRDRRFDHVFELLANHNDSNSPWTKNKWDTDLTQ